MLALLGFGCSSALEPSVGTIGESETGRPAAQPEEELDVVLPLDPDGFGYLPVYKRYGEYFDDRFRGYHVGDDFEIPADDEPLPSIPVRAVAEGTVAYLSNVDGYGGVIIVRHEMEPYGNVQTLYGHLDTDSTSLRTGDRVAKGQFLANLGADASEDTDGERQHLHFAVYEGTDVRLQAYVNSHAELSAWINPHDFFVSFGLVLPDPDLDPWLSVRDFWYPLPPRRDIPLAHAKYGELDFQIPNEWSVEYVPSLDALNLYTVSGTGSARERSQVLVRYFDANDFQTLSTVDVLSTEEITVGEEGYDARRYEIQKKTGLADFADQPSWRNLQHTVTDVRAQDGFSRFYVIAANPELDAETYERLLETMRVIE